MPRGQSNSRVYTIICHPRIHQILPLQDTRGPNNTPNTVHINQYNTNILLPITTITIQARQFYLNMPNINRRLYIISQLLHLPHTTRHTPQLRFFNKVNNIMQLTLQLTRHQKLHTTSKLTTIIQLTQYIRNTSTRAQLMQSQTGINRTVNI